LNPEWVIIAPLYNAVTIDTFDEAQDVIDYLKEKNVEYISLLDHDAIEGKVTSVLTEFPKCNFGHWDHGSPDAIWGDDNKPIISMSNVGILRNRDCYNSNCSSAEVLGKEVWKLGGVYWGSTDIVSYTRNALEEFKEAFNYGFKRRIDGFSWAECLKKTKARMTELADALVPAGKTLAGACMREDRDILVCYTVDSPPEPDSTWCPARKLAVKFASRAGWFISRRFAVGAVLQISGMILTPRSCWLGLTLTTSGFLLILSDTITWIKKQVEGLR